MISASTRNRWRLVRVVGVMVEHLLERHLAVQLGVEGDKDRAQAAAGMRPEHAEPQAVGGGRAERVAGRAVDVVVSMCSPSCRHGRATRNVGVR